MNTDAGFDCEDMCKEYHARDVQVNICLSRRIGGRDRDEHFDRQPFRMRHSTERTRTWMDSFRLLPNRFDTSMSGWKGWNHLTPILT